MTEEIKLEEVQKLSPRIKLTIYFKPGILTHTSMNFDREGKTNIEWSDKFKLVGGVEEFVLADSTGIYRYIVSSVVGVSIENLWEN